LQDALDQIPLINKVTYDTDNFAHCEGCDLSIDEHMVRVQIPDNFQKLKLHDFGAANNWRAETRSIFEAYFNKGYVVNDFVHANGTAYYILEKEFKVA